MNEEKPPITGRTKFDWMSENKDVLNRIILILVLILLIVIGILSIVVFGGKHNVKAGTDGIEISPIEAEESNAGEIKIDTISEAVEPNSQPLRKQSSPKKVDSHTTKTEVKMGDTSIVIENQPSNINFGDNSVVGNNINSTITVNPKEKLTEDEKRALVKELNLAFRAAKRRNIECAQVIAIGNHPKAIELRSDIEPFLIEQGYNIIPYRGMFLHPPRDKKIDFEAEEGFCMRILISFKD